MPSGLTSKIGTGATFPEFALGCAKQFGALIHMRDEPNDSKITLPESSEYYKEELEATQKKLKELQHINMKAYNANAITKQMKAIASVEKAIEDKNELRGKYMFMLMEVKAWRPPTPEHNDFKVYMTKQITDSIDFDCNTQYEDEQIERLREPVDANVLFNKEIDQLNEDVTYFTDKLNNENDTNSGRTKWIKDLAFSLRMTPEEKSKLLDFNV
jgi:hypothetical protein